MDTMHSEMVEELRRWEALDQSGLKSMIDMLLLSPPLN
jgi:hypothetical protein